MTDLNQPSSVQPTAASQGDVQPLSSTLAILPEDEGPEGEEPEEIAGEDDGGDEGRRCIKDEEEAAVVMPNDDDDTSQSQGRCSSVVSWFSSSAFLIYTSQILSAWGDRMWLFAVALYLVEIENYSLRLTAVFGLALTISVLLFGALVGQWVDRTPRLHAARRSLFVQNLSVIINAICLLLLLHYKTAVLQVGDGIVFFFCQVIIIVLGVVSNLASMAEKICIQKDWVVVLAGDSSERLAEMNATVRRIDLTVNILAPIIVGQIMTFASMTVAGIFVAAWNLASLILEYYLLLRVYKKVPRLAIKFSKENTGDATAPETEALTGQPVVPSDHEEEKSTQEEANNRPEKEQGDVPDASEDAVPDASEDAVPDAAEDAVPDASEDAVLASCKDDDEDGQTERGATGEAVVKAESIPGQRDPDLLTEETGETSPDNWHPAITNVHAAPPVRRNSFIPRITNGFLSTYHGWLIYKSYPVYLAGLALAFLYMTVMGFDSITSGYGYSMGLSEAMLGIIRGLGSIAGIAGTFAYPRMRQRIGVTRTGLYALSEEIVCLMLCICSIWAAGSPFNPHYYFSEKPNLSTVGPTINAYTTQMPYIPTPAFSSASPFDGGITDVNTTSNPEQKRYTDVYKRTIGNDTGGAATPQVKTDDTPQDAPDEEKPVKTFSSYASPILFFVGMVISRVGLWMFDLVTTQLIQENVRENERGVFNGMQRSLECSMDMLHFILVILLPSPETFGYLIILSFVFICIGAVFYCVFAFRDRGHLFHPEKIIVCMNRNTNGPTGEGLPENDLEV